MGLQIDEGIPTNRTSSYSPGSKVLLFAFTVLKRTVNEIVMEKNDKHLNYRLSIFLAQNDSKVYVITIIKYHNLGGRSYFGLIKPFHQLIVYSLVKKNLSLTT
ncbi:DUF2867 domain-containing protein [Sporomusa sp. KB1]|uniref:DUF2867 domain-containing protein n=1 Tax=Sporomusa sp. KB1 TaxID=943346 RepID=UPI00351AC544